MELRKIDIHNIWEITKLQVQDSQKNFVATNTQSILEAYVTITDNGIALPFGIYHEETLIGFVMIGYGNKEDEEPAVSKGNYCIWRFMIDVAFQGKGYGKEAMYTILQYIESKPCGDAKLCWLSYEPENMVGRNLYRAVGFVENGEICEGEIVAVRNL